MYAIIEESGGQRKIQQGDEILIDLIEGGNALPGKAITFDRILLVGGESTKLGAPYVAGASVTAEVIDPVAKGAKIEIQKFRTKKGYRRHTGHRQRYTKVRVTGINA